MSHPVQQLLGLTEEQLAELQQAVMDTGAAAYWAAIEEAIGKAMIEGRIWNGEPDTAGASRDFIRGQDGRVVFSLSTDPGCPEHGIVAMIAAPELEKKNPEPDQPRAESATKHDERRHPQPDTIRPEVSRCRSSTSEAADQPPASPETRVSGGGTRTTSTS